MLRKGCWAGIAVLLVRLLRLLEKESASRRRQEICLERCTCTVYDMFDIVAITKLFDHAPYQTFCALWSSVDCDEAERAFALL